MAAIAYRDEENDGYAFNCGGSLISRKFVLTATHCANRVTNPIFVRLGKTTLDDEDELTAIDINVKKIHLHGSYNSSIRHNDIALLELERTIAEKEFSRTLMPACLFLKTDRQKDLTISGWGIVDTDTHKKSNWMQKAMVSEISIQECKKSYPHKKVEFVDSQLCALNVKKAIDTCQGDSGGPIQMVKDGQYFIVGITSFGQLCGAPGIPGVYTRVIFKYLDWIESIVWPGE
ncbi:unnamed protein product [Diamesa tonsa]